MADRISNRDPTGALRAPFARRHEQIAQAVSFTSRIAGMFASVVVLGFGYIASAGPMPPPEPNALARALQTRGIEPAAGFKIGRPMVCRVGGAGEDWSYHCMAAFTDSARAARTAALEIMIFKTGYDFAREDSRVKAAVARLNARWKLDEQIDVGLDDGGQRIPLKASCHQGRGQTNGLAYCLLPLSNNVLVFSQAPPKQAGSDQVTTSTNGGADSFEDMQHAAQLASLAAIAVAKAQQGGPPPSNGGLSDSIFRVQRKPASTDDFCAILKTAVAAARTNFKSIPGPADEIMPWWRDATLSLPYADCNVDTDKRSQSYFCTWEKEQGAAVNARYKYTVRQTDQCLAGFRKTTTGQTTTWSNPAVGTVLVDSRHVMPSTQTWSLMLVVKR